MFSIDRGVIIIYKVALLTLVDYGTEPRKCYGIEHTESIHAASTIHFIV